MKFTTLFFVFFLYGSVVAQNFDIQQIRKEYNYVRQNYVDKVYNPDEDYPPPNYLKVDMGQMMSAIGYQKISLKFYFDTGIDEDPYKKSLRFVISTFNIAAPSYYEEFLFDDNENLIFYFYWDRFDNIQKRFYFKNNKLILYTEKRCVNCSDEDVFDMAKYKQTLKTNKVDDDILRQVRGKALNMKKIFSSVASVPNTIYVD